MELVHEELSYKIIGILYDVHNDLGGGHKEKIYQKALAVHLAASGLLYNEQMPVKLVTLGEDLGMYYLDFLVEDKVIIEIKARSHFRMADFRQTVSYLQALDKQLALLVVFTPTGVRYKRVVNLK